MTRFRVIVLFGQSLMLHGLLRWLAEQEGFEAVGTDIGEPDVRDRIRRFSPDAIIVDQDDIGANRNLTVSELISNYPETKVIKVDSASNTINVLRQQKIVIAQVDELLRLVAEP